MKKEEGLRPLDPRGHLVSTDTLDLSDPQVHMAIPAVLDSMDLLDLGHMAHLDLDHMVHPDLDHTDPQVLGNMDLLDIMDLLDMVHPGRMVLLVLGNWAHLDN